MAFPRPLRVLAVLTSVLAGCVGLAPAPADAGAGPVRYACVGAGGDGAEPCLADVSEPGVRFNEPAAAWHPAKAGTFAVAATRRATFREAPVEDGGAVVCRVVVHVTEDAGATWRASDPPPLSVPDALVGKPVAGRCARSASVAFDLAGGLHVLVGDEAWTHAFAAGAAQGEIERRVAHARSDDLGRSWSGPVVLHANGNHPNLALDPASGTLVATVRDFAGDGFTASAVRWSGDRGASWRGSGNSTTASCHLPTRAVFEGATAVFACTDHDALPDGMLVRIFALDTVSGALTPRGELPVPGARNLATSIARAADGRMALAWTPTIPGGAIAGDVFVALAPAGGGAFGAPLNLRAAAAPDAENTDWTRVEADAAGRFHGVLVVARGRDIESVHVAVDSGGRLAHRATLAAWTDAEDVPVDAAMEDDVLEAAFRGRVYSSYPAIAFGEGAGVLGFTSNAENRLRVTLLNEAGVRPPAP